MHILDRNGPPTVSVFVLAFCGSIFDSWVRLFVFFLHQNLFARKKLQKEIMRFLFWLGLGRTWFFVLCERQVKYIKEEIWTILWVLFWLHWIFLICIWWMSNLMCFLCIYRANNDQDYSKFCELSIDSLKVLSAEEQQLMWSTDSACLSCNFNYTKILTDAHRINVIRHLLVIFGNNRHQRLYARCCLPTPLNCYCLLFHQFRNNVLTFVP